MNTVRVLSVRKESPDVNTLLLEKPEGFTWTPGQFVVLQHDVEGKPMRRSYSIASAPHEDTIDITVKRQENGRFSPVLYGLKEGDSLGLLGPFGRFSLPDDERPLVFIAAGTGIAPFVSFLRTLARTADGRDVLLVDSNHTPEDILYREEVERLSGRLSLDVKHTITRPTPEMGWTGMTGRIDAKSIPEIGFPDDAWYLLCGSTRMVLDVIAALRENGVGLDRIRTEKFGNIVA